MGLFFLKNEVKQEETVNDVLVPDMYIHLLVPNHISMSASMSRFMIVKFLEVHTLHG